MTGRLQVVSSALRSPVDSPPASGGPLIPPALPDLQCGHANVCGHKLATDFLEIRYKVSMVTRPDCTHLRPLCRQRQRFALLQRQPRQAGRQLGPQRNPPPALVLHGRMHIH